MLVVGIDGLMLCSVDRLLFLREGLELQPLRFIVGDFEWTLSGPEIFFFVISFACSFANTFSYSLIHTVIG